MPNTNEFHLYIHMDDLAEESAMAGGGGETQSESGGSDKTAGQIKSAAKKIVGYAAIKSTADQIISGQLSQVALTTGATEYESRLQTGYNVFKQALGVGEAMVSGFLLSGGNPLGAVAGLFVSGIHQIISYEQKKQVLAKQENLENVSIDFMNVRAGTAGRRSRDQ